MDILLLAKPAPMVIRRKVMKSVIFVAVLVWRYPIIKEYAATPSVACARSVSKAREGDAYIEDGICL